MKFLYFQRIWGTSKNKWNSRLQITQGDFSPIFHEQQNGSKTSPRLTVLCVQCTVDFFISVLKKKYDLPPAGVIISRNVQCLKLHRAQPVCYSRWMRTQCFMKLLLNICRMTFSHSIPLKCINSFYTQGKKKAKRSPARSGWNNTSFSRKPMVQASVRWPPHVSL